MRRAEIAADPVARSARRIRRAELLLLVFAWFITLAALLQVQLGVRGDFDWTVVALAGLVAAMTLAMHIVLRFRAPQADPFMLPIATALNGLGIAMIYRLQLGGDRAANANAQIIYTGVAIGLGVVVVLFLRNHRVLQRYTYLSMVGAIVLLVLPFVPGLRIPDAAAVVWIRIGGVNFQPGEIAKILLAIFFAGYLVTARDTLSIVGRKVLGVRLPRMRDLGPILIVWALCMAILVLQRDLGTSMLFFALFVVMIYIATGRLSWVILGLVLTAVGVAVAASQIGYVQFRFSAWLRPFDQTLYEASGGSYQLVQSLFGMGFGGLIGTGLGQGHPGITPAAESDYIFSALAEELGLGGAFAILALYLLLVARGIRIGHQGRDDFGRLLAAGLAFAIGIQVFVVVGGVTRVIPLSGLTTPFLAAGGSSLVANWIIVAILLRLSDTVRSEALAPLAQAAAANSETNTETSEGRSGA